MVIPRAGIAVVIAVTVVLATSASATQPATAASRFAPLSGRFVFSCSGCPQNQSGPSLFVVAATGTGLREILHSQPPNGFPPTPPAPYYPRWSPHGTSVVFSNAFAEIWRVNVATEAPRRITRSRAERDTDPAFSPDGRRVVYAQHCSLVTRRVTGGTATLLARRAKSCFGSPDWSPDGKRVLLHLSGHQLFIVDANGRELRAITARSGFARYPRWSPDGKRIAFISSGPSLVVMNADGSNRHAIVRRDDLNFNVNPAWSPDGRRIAFVVTNTFDTQQDLEGNQILTTRLDGSDTQPVEIAQLPPTVYSEIYGIDWR